jgi:thioredoxin
VATKKQFTSLDEILTGSEVPVLVDFYATWCGPCQLMAKILEQVNGEMKHQLQIVKIDSDKYPNLASQYQVQALPTLILFKQRQPVERIEGVLPVEQLTAKLRQFI